MYPSVFSGFILNPLALVLLKYHQLFIGDKDKIKLSLNV